ncbi:MAG: hypothetical protein OER95_02165 [Acidimicrobiia bacterium]|nr:hypothetical protein [Acidimicrobiia bacterium]
MTGKILRHQLHREIIIDASPEQVRDSLTAPDRYESWNPFAVVPEGRVADGGARRVLREFFRGVLVPWLGSSPDTKIRRRFELLDDALKTRVGSSVGVR